MTTTDTSAETVFETDDGERRTLERLFRFGWKESVDIEVVPNGYRVNSKRYRRVE
jgi:hypothetical protein